MKRKLFNDTGVFRALSSHEPVEHLEEVGNLVIDIPENSVEMQQFQTNHPRMYHWLHTSLGQQYLNKQINRAG